MKDKMNGKIGLIICGSSGIDYLNIDYPYEIIRSTLVMNGAEYEDYVDISAEEFYKVLDDNPDTDVSTSQTATGVIADKYEKMKKDGYTDIIVLTLSSGLSGTYQGAMLAKELVEELNVYVIDTKTVSHSIVYLAEEAIKMIKKGEKMSSIIDRIENMRNNVHIYVLVDTLKYLVKNGRLSQTSGFLGSLLKIKPLLHINFEGNLVPYEKIRTKRKARSRMLEILQAEIKGKNVELFIAFTNNKEEAVEFKKDMLENDNNLDIKIVPLTPVVGAHAGPGTLGFGYIVK